MATANNYLKNVMKSVAYAAVDVSNNYMPNMKEFASTNKEFAVSTYSALRNPPQFIRKQAKAIQETKIFKALDYGAKNLVEDLRTGNFYNKERKERDELKFSGIDFDNYDDLSDFGIDDDWEKNINSSASKSNDEITAGDLKIVDSIEGSNAALASATVNAVVATSQNEIKNSRANTAIIYSQNEKLFGGIHKDMTILGSTMQQMYKLQSASLQNIDKNMSGFFTQESKLSAERNAILKEMLELQRSVYKSANDKQKETTNKKSNRIRWSDINVNGTINLSAYFKAVKKNISNELSVIMPAGFGEDSNMLATFMTSPLEGVMKYIVEGLVPATVKAASKELDGTISGVFGNIIGALGNARSKNDNGILGTIAKFFGVSTGVSRNIDTSKYEKGPVPFDGITRKAIVEVIPTYLRRIEATITGRPEETFDYKTGRWVKVNDIKKRFDDIKKNAIRNATSDIREEMNVGIRSVRDGLKSKSSRDSFDKAVEEFQEYLYNNNGRFNPNISADKNGIDYNYPNLKRYYNVIRTIYKDFDRIETKDKNGKPITRHTKNRARLGISPSVLGAKEAEDRQYRSIESDLGNIFQMYFGAPEVDKHGKYNGGSFKAYNILNNTKDNLGNTIFDYLQNINKELAYMRSNGVFGGGSGTGKAVETVSMADIVSSINKNKSTSTVSSYNQDKAIERRALEKIQSGKAVDLRDLDENEKDYLLSLSAMVSGGAIDNYKSEISGYNENVISKFIDKQFIKTNIKNNKDIEAAIKKAEKEGKNTSDIKMDKKEEKLFDKIIKRFNAGSNILGSVVGASAEAFTNVLYAADKAIYEMMYKTEIENEDGEGKYKGFLDAMVGKMSDSFKKLREKFNEDVLQPFKDRFKDIFGTDTDNFKEAFKKDLKNKGSKLWTAFIDANKSVYSPLFNKIMPEKEVDYEELEAQELERRKQERKAAQKYKKSTITTFKNKYQSTKNITNKNLNIALKNGTKEWGVLSGKSEKAREARNIRTALIYNGTAEEIAIWCEQNGFTGSLDEKKVRLDSEFGLPAEALSRIQTDEDANLAYIKQFKHNAKGTPSGRPFTGLTTLTKGEGLISGRGVGIVPKTGVYNVTTPTHIINTENMHSITGSPRVSVQTALGREKLAAKSAGFNVASHGKGTPVEINGKEIDTKQILEEAKLRIPEAASGGLIGGILSLVLGLAGGPILGAAVGAGGSIIASSDKIKEKLFGKVGKDGERDDSGIISKTITDKFKKYFPDMAKYGMAGILPGLITPLGPVGGLMAGAAFGFLKNNQKFNDKYLGEGGKLHLGNKEKNIIKKLAPNTIKGAGIGAIAGLFLPSPFGLLGNAALGAGLGLMSSTEDFKDLILGKEINGERVGGIFGAFKEALKPFTDAMKNAGERLSEAFENNVITPLSKFLAPAIHAVPIALGAIPRKISEILDKKTQGIRRTIAGAIKDKLSPVTKLASKPIKWAAGGISKITSVPGKLLGKAGDSLRAYDIRHGDFVNMNQTEAVEWMIENGRKDQISDMLRVSANVGSGKEDFAGKGSITKDQAESLRNTLNAMNSSEGRAKKNLTEANNKLNKLLDSYKDPETGKKLSSKQINEILKLANSGNFAGISDVLQKRNMEGSREGMTKAQFNDFFENGGLKEAVINAAEAKTRLNTLNEWGGDSEKAKEAQRKMNEMLESLGLDPSVMKDKKKRAEFSKLLSDKLVELEAAPEDAEKKLQEEDNKNIKSISTDISDILKLMLARESDDDEQIKAVKEKIGARLDLGKKHANERYDTNTSKTLAGMSKEEAAKVNEKGLDIASTGKHKKDAQRYGANGLNNATAGFKGVNKVFAHPIQELFSDLPKEIIKRIAPETYSAVGKLHDWQQKNIRKSLGNKYIRTVILDGGYTIDPNMVKILADSTYSESLKKNCWLLTQIYKKPNGENIYSRFNDLQSIANLSLADKAALRQEFSVDATDKSASIIGDLGRTAKEEWHDAKNTVKEVKAEVKGAAGKVTKKAKDGARTVYYYTKAIHTDKWHMKHDDGSVESADDTTKTVEPNSLGTLLLGAGKSILGFGKNVVNGVSSLFSKKDKESKGAHAGLLSSLFGSIGNMFHRNNAGSNGNMDEVDKPGDGRDVVHVGDGDMINIKRDSSGNVEPDTSDSKTKTVLNKLSLKERAANKLHEAQLKASEIIKNTFDTSEVKGSKGGKLGWFSLLLGGTLLWKTGLLQKLFNGVIKPIWSDHLKPWITDTAMPWVSDKWNNHIKPWIVDTAIPAIGNFIGEVIKSIDWTSLLKGTANLIGGVLDGVTGNKYNAGSTTKVDASNLSEKYGSDYKTQMTDENGNKLTYGDIESGNYNEIYNVDGTQGTVTDSGDVKFKDKSLVGASYMNTVLGATGRQFLKSVRKGGNTFSAKLTKKALSASTKLAKSKHGPFKTVRKLTGKAGQAVFAPIDYANHLGDLTNQVIDNATDQVGKTANNAAKAAVNQATDQAAKTATKAAGETIEKVTKDATDKVASAVVKNADNIVSSAVDGASKVAKDTVKNAADTAVDTATDIVSGATKSTGIVAKMVSKVTTFVDKLFKNTKVYNILTKLAKQLGKTKPGQWIEGLKKKIDDVFSEAVEKVSKKVGANVLKTAAKVLGVVMFIADFLSGMDRAEAILGVTETTLLEEVVAGLLNALLGLIPVVSMFSEWIIKKIFEFFDKDLSERQKQAEEEYQQYVEETGSTMTQQEYLEQQYSYTGKAKSGIKNWWNKITGKNKVNDTNTGSIATNAVGTINMSALTQTSSPLTALYNFSSNGILGDLTSGEFNFNNVNDTITKVKDGTMSIFSKDYWRVPENTDNTLKGAIEQSYTMLAKLINFPILLIKNALDTFSTDIETLGTGEVTEVDNVTVKTTIGGKIKNAISKAVSAIKNMFSSGTGSYQYGTGLYSKQIDPSVAGIRFNSSSDEEYQTIGNSGCGPAAAVNVLESMYGRGNAVANAAKFAIKRGYKETNGGTKPGFFTDYFNSNGLNSKTSFNKSDIARSIVNGMPTVIMGSDDKGTSSSTPFGKTPHYVTVTGTDGRGNAIVQDPESRYDNQLYPINSLMRNTSFGVSAFGKNYRGKYGRGEWKAGPYDSQIWWYLITKMGLTPSGAAGLMGNLYAESGLRPNNLQDSANKSLGMTDAEYTAAVDSGTITKEQFIHPWGDDKVTGYGLAQWTSAGRKEGLYDYIASKGDRSISDLSSQLEWLQTELESGSYSKTYEAIKGIGKTVKQASDAVLTNFEQPSDQSDDVKDKRYEYSQKIFEKFRQSTGTEITDITTRSLGNTEETKDSNSNSSGKDILSNILSTITGHFTDLFENSGVGQAFSTLTDWISNLFTTSSSDSEEPTTTPNDEDIADILSNNKGDIDAITRIARSQVGTKETEPNYVKYNDWFYGQENSGGDDKPWCSVFTSWVANQAGVDTSIIPKTATCRTGYNYFKSNNRTIETNQTQPGDYIYFTKTGAVDDIHHTGIVTGYKNGIISTVEGNSSNMVAERRYQDSDDGIFIARPNYKNPGTITQYNSDAAISNWYNHNTRGGNGNKPLSRYGQFKNSIYGTGGGANVVKTKTDYGYITTEIHPLDKKYMEEAHKANQDANYGKGTVRYGMAGSMDYSKLINSIISILMTIADNTDKLNLIVSILNEKLNLNVSASDVSNSTTGSQTLKSKLANALSGIGSSNANNTGDGSINAIITAMNAIAAE